MDLFTEEALLWIIDYRFMAKNKKGLKFKSLKDGFVSYKHAASHFSRC